MTKNMTFRVILSLLFISCPCFRVIVEDAPNDKVTVLGGRKDVYLPIWSPMTLP
jgi:hypothetical protein